MTAHDLREETALTVVSMDVETSVSVPDSEAATPRVGDPQALFAARLLASAALVVSALVHAKLALHLGMGGPLLGQSHLFAAHAVLSGLLAGALFTRDNRVWLVAVVLSVAGLGAILASVYFPVPAVGPFQGFDEPAWLLSKAVCAMAELSVIVLWLIRQIAPPQPPA
jgi:hypothetical protein